MYASLKTIFCGIHWSVEGSVPTFIFRFAEWTVFPRTTDSHVWEVFPVWFPAPLSSTHLCPPFLNAFCSAQHLTILRLSSLEPVAPSLFPLGLYTTSHPSCQGTQGLVLGPRSLPPHPHPFHQRLLHLCFCPTERLVSRDPDLGRLATSSPDCPLTVHQGSL